jgi:hypothetical protein
MQMWQPASEIIEGLTTTADKTRALAQSNYDRAVIAKILNYSQIFAISMSAMCCFTPESREVCAVRLRPIVNQSKWRLRRHHHRHRHRTHRGKF